MTDTNAQLSPDARMHYRNQMRQLRAWLDADGEAFGRAVVAIEQLGDFLSGTHKGFNHCKSSLLKLANASPLATEVPAAQPVFHLAAEKLLSSVQFARNDAFHRGAAARHAASSVSRLSIVLEDALNAPLTTVSEFMVRDPTCAEPWQPCSYARQKMLENSFTFLPVNIDGEWHLLSDRDLATYLQPKGERTERLAVPISDAAARKELQLLAACVVSSRDSVEDALRRIERGTPVLVADDSGHLVGILTAFDLL